MKWRSTLNCSRCCSCVCPRKSNKYGCCIEWNSRSVGSGQNCKYYRVWVDLLISTRELRDATLTNVCNNSHKADCWISYFFSVRVLIMALRPNTVWSSCDSEFTLYVCKSSNASSSLSKHPNMSHPPALPQRTAHHQTAALFSALAGWPRSRGATRPQITPVNIHSLFFST